MGDESTLSRQIRSVERSVVFLRQEHLTLLHGLHLEVLSLQKRCSGEEHTLLSVCEGGKKLLHGPQRPSGLFSLLFLLIIKYKPA